jgi:aminoglycoside phosphotransferase (APT) family kinase protein
MTSDPIRRRPPEPTLHWVTRSVGAGSRIVSIRRFTDGGWHANHALTVADRAGKAHRLVLRRWARPEWIVEDPDFTAEREAGVLELISGTPVPAPKLVAADPDGEACDVPTLLISRLPGRPPGLPRDMGAFLAHLARAVTEIHAASDRLRERVPDYRNYHDHRSAAAPRWSHCPKLWERALELARTQPPPGPRCFIHRDYHPENTLWSRGRLTGVVDWTSASWGPAAVDVAHMRWNLALTYGLDAADEFLRLYRSFTSEARPDQRYWDVVTVLDLVCDLNPNDWPTFDVTRLERYLERVLAPNAADRLPSTAAASSSPWTRRTWMPQ